MRLQSLVFVPLFIHHAYSNPLFTVTNGSSSDFSCEFTHGRHHYNLCPLLQPNGPKKPFELERHESTPPTQTTHNYQIALFNGGLRRDEKVKDEYQCPRGTWVCKTVTNMIPNNPSSSRILQVIPVVKQDGLNITGRFYHGNRTNETLYMDFKSNNSYVGQRHYLQIVFECDKEAKEPTLPRYRFSGWTYHVLLWKSKHACPKQLPLGTPHPPTKDLPDGGEDETPGNSDTENPEDKFVLKPIHRRWSYGKISLSIGVVVLILFLAHRFISRDARQQRLISKLRFTSIALKNASRGRFRPTPKTLLRWAQQEPDYDYEELDLTNNPQSGPIRYEVDGSGDQDGEEIPLSPSPKATFSSGKGKGSGGREYTNLYGSFGN